MCWCSCCCSCSCWPAPRTDPAPRCAHSCDWLFGTFEDGTRWSKEHVQKLRAKADKGNLDPTIADTAEQMAAIDAAQGKAVETQANPAAEGKKKA